MFRRFLASEDRPSAASLRGPGTHGISGPQVSTMPGCLLAVGFRGNPGAAAKV